MSATIALIVGTGWGARTFLQTAVLDTLADRARVVVLAHPTLLPAIRERAIRVAAVAPLAPFDPHVGEHGRWFRRRNRLFLHRAMTTTRRANLRRSRRHDLRGRLRSIATWIESASTGPAHVDRLVARETAAYEADHADDVARYRRFLEDQDVRLAVSTTAYLAIEAPPMRVARSLGIATACWINSWDNPTSKGALPITYDAYFLWSSRMREDLNRYYPETRDRPCTAVGVPHFDRYADVTGDRVTGEGDRQAYCRRVGLDPARPILLYAACTPFLAPDEHLVVERLADDIDRGRLPGRPQLVVRLHPADPGARFAALSKRVDVTVDVPGAARDGRPAGIDGFLPDDADSRHAIESVVHADAVINIASTISLEAVLADRPTINVAYDLAPGAPNARRIREYYRYEHYRPVTESGAVSIADGPERLVEAIAESIEHPDRRRRERQALARLLCAPPAHPPADGLAGTRLATALLRMVEA